MESECINNIKELHVFIESWLKGSVAKTKQVFQYFEDQLDENFIIIHPSGEQQTKADIIGDFWNAFAVQTEEFGIEIRHIKIRAESSGLCIVNYEEWQTGIEKSARISTVIFRESKKSNKIKWLHLHETWFPNN